MAPVPQRHQAHRGVHAERQLRPALLLPSGPQHPGQLPHVLARNRRAENGRQPPAGPRIRRTPRNRLVAQTANFLRARNHRRDGRPHQLPAGRGLPQGRDGIPPHQPSARLPHLRQSRRMPPAGIRRRVRQRRIELHRGQSQKTQAPRHRQTHRPRRRTLHPLLPLRPLHAGSGPRRRPRLRRSRQPHHADRS